MKKVISFFILCVISIGLIGCVKDKQVLSEPAKKLLSNNEIIELVYKDLPTELKETINYDLKTIKLNKTTLKEHMGTVDKSYMGKEVYEIEFTIKATNVFPNDRIVFAEPDSYKIIGYGLVE